MTIYAGTISYGLATAAFLLLTLLLLMSGRHHSQGTLLALAAFGSSLWSAGLAYTATPFPSTSLLASTLEVIRSILWLVFIIRAIRLLPGQSAEQGDRRRMRYLSTMVLGYAVVLLGATVVIHGGDVSSRPTENFFVDIVGRILLAVAAMGLVEQFFRNAPPAQRWGIKYLCLGLGGMFAYDFFLYADAMLFRHIDPQLWAARGIVNALTMPLIVISTARNPDWAFDVHVSRRFVFHTTSLFGAGIYLLIMAVAGYYIRMFGGSWGGVFQAAFFFGAFTLLISMLFSGTLRAKLKVFLSKHFFTYKFDYREEWLRFTRALSKGAPGERPYERLVQAIAELVESPAGCLWVRHDGGGFVRTMHWNMPGVGNEAEPADGPLARFLRERQWVINLEEYSNTPELYGDLDMPVWLRQMPRAWLVVPLILHEELVGFIVLARARSEHGFNWEVSDLLKTAGQQAASYLAQMRAADALLVARQFESFNRMSAFVVHDLKNLVAQLSLMLSNAEKYKHNPEFQDDMISTVENSVEKMNRLLAQLRRGGTPSETVSRVEVGDLMRRVLADKVAFKPHPAIVEQAAGLSVCADSERLQRVVGHIVQNACEATPYDGKVEIRLSRDEACAIIEIEDSGVGMDEQFIRERLFQPFDSTKGSGMGIGAHECREYIQSLGGRVDVRSVMGAGSTFTIRIPAA
jgi:putative PEP-CTERM system histidine kinase